MDYRVKQRLRKVQMIHKLLLRPEHQILIQELVELYQISKGSLVKYFQTRSRKLTTSIASGYKIC